MFLDHPVFGDLKEGRKERRTSITTFGASSYVLFLPLVHVMERSMSGVHCTSNSYHFGAPNASRISRKFHMIHVICDMWGHDHQR